MQRVDGCDIDRMDQSRPGLSRWLQVLPHTILPSLKFQINGRAGAICPASEAGGRCPGEQPRVGQAGQDELKLQGIHV